MTGTVSDCLRRLPRKLRVGAYDWRILLNEGEGDSHGRADFGPRVLELWPDSLTGPEHAVGIVLHECLHIVWDNHTLGKQIVPDLDDTEENIIVGFEQGLVQLFRDNPKLMTWIKKGLK